MSENFFRENIEDFGDNHSGVLAKLYILRDDSTSSGLLSDSFAMKPREVTDYDFSFTQSVDKDNQPSGIPRGGKIKIKVKAFKKDVNSDFLNWMVKRLKRNGYIQIMDPTKLGDTLTKIEFFDSYCVDYKQWWSDKVESKDIGLFNSADQKDKAAPDPSLLFKSQSSHKTEFQEEISITWRKLIIDGVTFENRWL
jgi:hypothetical protein